MHKLKESKQAFREVRGTEPEDQEEGSLAKQKNVTTPWLWPSQTLHLGVNWEAVYRA